MPYKCVHCRLTVMPCTVKSSRWLKTIFIILSAPECVQCGDGAINAIEINNIVINAKAKAHVSGYMYLYEL